MFIKAITKETHALINVRNKPYFIYEERMKATSLILDHLCPFHQKWK